MSAVMHPSRDSDPKTGQTLAKKRQEDYPLHMHSQGALVKASRLSERHVIVMHFCRFPNFGLSSSSQRFFTLGDGCWLPILP